MPELQIERYQLDCGARLLVSPRPGASVTAIELHLRGGHALDPEDAGGTAYLTGALLDQGTAKRDEAEIAERLELAGGGIQGGSAGIAGNVASGEWRTLLELVAEMVTTPTFPRRNVERERARLVDRLSIDASDPRSQGSALFRRLVFGDHWLGRRDSGTAESVAGIERRHLTGFHRKHWCASRALIVVCGDVQGAEVQRYLNRALRGWKTGSLAQAREDVFPPLRPRCDAFRAQRQQVHVMLGHLGVTRKNPDFPALVVMDHILGTGPGFTNRIPGKLRDELGLAYTVSANLTGSAGVLPGTFTAYIGTSPEHLETSVHVFLDELRRIQREEPSEEEVELAVRYVTGSMALGFERASSRARHLVFAERNELSDDHLQRFVDDVLAVRASDVREAAERHLHPESPCLVVAGPVSKAEVRRLVK